MASIERAYDGEIINGETGTEERFYAENVTQLIGLIRSRLKNDGDEMVIRTQVREVPSL